MRRLGRPALALVAASLLVSPARAADTPDPLRFVPAAAQLVLKVEDPRQLAEAVYGLDAVLDAQELAPVRAALDSTTARRLFQMLAYVERELGADWPELLDQVAGGGVAVAVTYGADDPALLVMQGTDEKQVAKAFDLFARVLGDELARQGSPGAVVRQPRGRADTFRVGNDLFAGRFGATVFVSNKPMALAAGLKLAMNPDPERGVLAKQSIRDAKQLLPKNPLAWLWLDFATIKKAKATADFLEGAKKDLLGNLVLGGTLDCLRRSDFVAAGFYREEHGLRLAVRLPAGRSGFPDGYVLHTPPADEPGSLPLLEPPGVLYSQSFYLDFGHAWENRADLFSDEVRGQIEKAEADISKVLPGSAKLGELLTLWGPHHRLVAVNRTTNPYKTKPAQVLPGFGYVASMRDPQFGRSLESAARAGALIATIQFGMKMTKTDHAGVEIVAYRFSETKPFPDDPDGLRFNFEPCFATVGDAFIVASTVEVCRKLIDEVKRTAGEKPSPVVWRAKGYADAAGNALAGVPEPLITTAVLEQGIDIDAAREQVAALTKWVKTLGTVRVEIDEAATAYRFDLVWEQE